MKNSIGTFALLVATTLAGMDTAQATAPEVPPFAVPLSMLVLG
jgi:hypothetical protein